MSDNRKYIFINGVPVINPQFQSSVSVSSPTTTVVNNNALAIVSSMDDQMAMAGLTSLPVPKQFQEAMNTIQSDQYVAGFKSQAVDGGTVIDGLMKVFELNQIPLGLMSKLTPLQGATLHFKIDDSGSMAYDSNLLLSDASWYTKQTIKIPKRFLSRWEEAEDRLHTLIDLLAYVPTGPIFVSFFDRGNQRGAGITLNRNGMTPEDFARNAHLAVHNLFLRQPLGNTPILLNLTNMLIEANTIRARTDSRTMHYILTDGEPSDGPEEVRAIKNLLQSQSRFASSNPITFLGCSNDRKDYAWMHEVEEVAPYVAALPDFRDEFLEVQRDQGAAFPYSRGFWLLCNVAASINPDDLDALDQHSPFTKATLENLMGRGLTPQEYRQYFNFHPNASRIFEPDFNAFLTAQYARDIPSVQLFQRTLSQGLAQDMDKDEDDTEGLEVKLAEQAVLNSRGYNSRVNAPQFSGSMYYNSGSSSSAQYGQPGVQNGRGYGSYSY